MSSPADLANAAQALAAALLAATSDPADAIQLLSSLADFTPNSPTSGSAIGAAISTMQDATGDLFRRAAVVALARASATYQPSSSDDAVSVRNAVTALLDAEITIAGDQGEDASYGALRALRVAVVQDLNARGAALAPLATFTFNSSRPALTLANQLYRDATRSDELITQADPPHPAFMPLTVTALAD